jgi:formylmethanofuran dehydrogenase subunit E
MKEGLMKIDVRMGGWRKIRSCLVAAAAVTAVMGFAGVASGNGKTGRWDDMPTITLRLPGKTDAAWKEACCSGKDSKKGLQYDCSRYITLTIPDMEKYYGDVGPGLVLGYRACQIAFAHLYPGEIPPRGDQFILSGAASCPADPLMFITGARYGKDALDVFNGNMVFDRKIEPFSFIFASMSNGRAFKLTCKYKMPKEFLDLMEQKKRDPAAVEKFWTMAHCLSRYIMTAPASEIYEVTPLSDFSWKEYKGK